jgi:hypothetical protein
VTIGPGNKREKESKRKKETLMRNACWECVEKHLAAACVLADEARYYPVSGFLAIGHLVEAEAEVTEFDPDFASAIRDIRRLYWKALDKEKWEEAYAVIDIRNLFTMVCQAKAINRINLRATESGLPVAVSKENATNE